LSKVQNQNSDLHKQFYPRVENRTNITFSSDELALLNKDLKYSFNYKRKNWIETLALETETAVSYLPCTEQEYLRFQIAHNLKLLYEHYENSQGYNTRNMNKETHILHNIKNKLQSNKSITYKSR
jgi:5'-deoxynucleotidase YfbR-like HD superfamily hydrolase